MNFLISSWSAARENVAAVIANKGPITEVTSPDVAPAIERIFGIRKGFYTEKGFKDYLKEFVKEKIDH